MIHNEMIISLIVATKFLISQCHFKHDIKQVEISKLRITVVIWIQEPVVFAIYLVIRLVHFTWNLEYVS